MDQPPALPKAEAAEHGHTPAPGASVPDWESDLADLATVPLEGVDSLAPLPRTARVLKEVLRSRSGIRSNPEPRAE